MKEQIEFLGTIKENIRLTNVATENFTSNNSPVGTEIYGLKGYNEIIYEKGMDNNVEYLYGYEEREEGTVPFVVYNNKYYYRAHEFLDIELINKNIQFVANIGYNLDRKQQQSNKNLSSNKFKVGTELYCNKKDDTSIYVKNAGEDKKIYLYKYIYTGVELKQ